MTRQGHAVLKHRRTPIALMAMGLAFAVGTVEFAARKVTAQRLRRFLSCQLDQVVVCIVRNHPSVVDFFVGGVYTICIHTSPDGVL